MARVRKSVWDIVADPSDATLDWYAKGVAAMQARPFVDPTSWRFQAAMHGWLESDDPLANPSDPPPPQSTRDKYFEQCQHGHWFFLPWHRMYLHFFEQILLKEIVAQGGPADWALPYWNYSASAAHALLPDPFRNPQLGSGPNPLFVQERVAAANAGLPIADAADTALDCLTEATFSPAPGSAIPRSFGGASAVPTHFLRRAGELELTPHGNMHVAVGGTQPVAGWMSAFHKAALDPIFWLHHSNIDRLWEVWLQRDAAHQSPDQALWLSRFAFDFHDAQGNPTQLRCQDVLRTVAAPLDYEYADISDPLAPVGLVSMGVLPVAETPELIGATLKPFAIGTGPINAAVPTLPTTPAGLVAMGAPNQPTRLVLGIEHLTCEVPAPSFDVYLGVPPGADPSRFADRRAGRITLFGIDTASRRDGPHAGSGLSFQLEVTELVDKLKNDATWNPSELQVAFVPVRGNAPVPVQVGRVSLYAA